MELPELKRRRGKREAKVRLSLRVDPDILKWYRGLGPGWQGEISKLLRWYMEERDKQEAEQSATGSEDQEGNR